MSAAAETAEVPASAATPPAKSGKLGVIIGIVIAVLVSIAGSAGIAWFMVSKLAPKAPAAEGEAASEEHKEPKAPAEYVKLEPAFVVNLADEDAARYLQVDIEAVTREPKGADDIKLHMPRIRNALLLLLGTRNAFELATRVGKEKLQADVTAEIQKVMTEETGKPLVEAVYFNSFVVQ